MPIESSKTSTATWRRWVKGQIAALSGGGGGQWVLISTTVPTSSPTVDITWDETAYDEVKLHIDGIYGASAYDRQLTVQLGYDDGASFHSTSGDYAGTFRDLVSTTFTAMSPTTYHLCGHSVLNVDTSYGGLSGYVSVISGSGTNSGAIIESRTHHVYGANQIYGYEAKSYLVPLSVVTGSEADIDSVRLQWDGSSINFSTGGVIRLYGLKNS